MVCSAMILRIELEVRATNDSLQRLVPRVAAAHGCVGLSAAVKAEDDTGPCGGGHETANSAAAAGSSSAPHAPGGSPPTPKPALPALYLTRPLRSCPPRMNTAAGAWPASSRQTRRLSGHSFRHSRSRQELRASQPQRENHLHDQRQRRSNTRIGAGRSVSPLTPSEPWHWPSLTTSNRPSESSEPKQKSPSLRPDPRITSRPAETSALTA